VICDVLTAGAKELGLWEASPQGDIIEDRGSQITSVDVTRQGIDKAYGMRRLMDLLGLVRADVLFFGDQLDEGGNDYPVKSTGIDTIAVRDSTDTALALQVILAISSDYLAGAPIN
jgi:phosphomannomutase